MNSVVVYSGSPTGVIASAPRVLVAPDAMSSGFGSALAAAGDVNGDGFPDLAVGACSSGCANRAFVFNGSSDGVSMTPSAILEAPAGASEFGYAVSTAGDVNRDGFADIAVGAPGSGHVFVYTGSSTGVATTPAYTLSAAPATRFGTSLSWAGDVDGDGSDDLVVGAPATVAAMVTRSAWIFYAMGDLVTSRSARLEGLYEFGASVSSAGDVNHDGFADVLIGRPHALGSLDSAFVHHGGIGGIASSPSANHGGGSSFGSFVSSANDVNRDGFDDIVVGDPLALAAAVVLGGPTGTMGGMRFALDGAGALSFGWCVVGVGDVNADGYADVAVGAPGARQVLVYHGRRDGISTSADLTLTRPLASFGTMIAR